MPIDEARAYSAHASYCSNQATSAQDDRLKAYWNELADSWIVLHKDALAREKGINARILQPR